MRDRLIGLAAPGLLLAAMMWRVRTYTVDDAFISFRYARNFARGEGLVYNVGEQVEGYTNFLWTVLLGWGIRQGLDPELLAKLMGAASGLVVLALTYRLSARIRPLGGAPCVATWLPATSITTTVDLSGFHQPIPGKLKTAGMRPNNAVSIAEYGSGTKPLRGSWVLRAPQCGQRPEAACRSRTLASRSARSLYSAS